MKRRSRSDWSDIPILQAADILTPRAHLVPVGKDNLAHVEVTREIARPRSTAITERSSRFRTR